MAEWSNEMTDALIKTATSQVVGNNYVCNCVEYELDISGICCAGHMAVDFLGC